MINFKDVLIALNVKGNEIANGLGIDVCFGGRTVAGAIYEPSPKKNYINFDLMPNEIERRSLKDGEAEIMRNGIYQATVFVGKSGDKNPDMESMTITHSIRQAFSQGLRLTSNAQSCVIVKSDLSPPLPNETHHSVAVSVYFDCIA